MSSNVTEDVGAVTSDDATWILTAAFVIFTMQTGFGLLESGAVSKKNEVNILSKNAVDVILGGLSYWVFGYGLQYGKEPGTTIFCGVGYFLLDSSPDEMGIIFATFIFQLSFATTATTIVSGAMAERANFNAYCIFSFVNTVVYCIPAGWIWGDHGYLKHLGALDFAGSSAVHLVGGASALVACLLLKPRLRKIEAMGASLPMGNSGNAVVGTFTLWWGWLMFNCGSTFGISNNKWHYAGRAAINTMNASLGGGIAAIFYTYWKNKQYNVSDILNGILAALVGVTAGSAFLGSASSVLVGAVGAILSCYTTPMFEKFDIDDPVSAIAVHGVGGIWGMAAVGLFIEDDPILELSNGRKGLFQGGGFYLLGVQLLTCLCVIIWSMSTTYIFLTAINKIIPIRMEPGEEILGADFVEHDIRHDGYDYELMINQLKLKGQFHEVTFKHRLSRSQWDTYLIDRYLPNGPKNLKLKYIAWIDRPSSKASDRFLLNGNRRGVACIVS
ncbi:putative ammonium transporter 3 [Centruroides sculpturatus]|uniref:putative ammonium transporter 3 n=1 Tax=Centruroides sculpturatus TaxID=218467 RepID=UPI000C6CD1F8|nr:putative ammonium transporter 3 [Centruroides sculpturatus]